MGWVCLADYVWMYCTKAFHVLAFPSWWNTNPLQLNQHSSLCGTFCTEACHLLILEYYLVCDKLTGKKARSGKKGAQKSFKRGLPPGKWWHEIPPWDQLFTLSYHPPWGQLSPGFIDEQCVKAKAQKSSVQFFIMWSQKAHFSKLLSNFCHMQLCIYLQLPIPKCNLLY